MRKKEKQMHHRCHSCHSFKTHTLFLFAALLCIASSANAQSSYKCEADGKVTYQATPCVGGKAMDAAAAPSAAQKKQAVEENMRNESAVKDMAADRKMREREKTKAGLGEIGTMKATSMQEREGVKINKKKGKANKAKRAGKAAASKPPKAAKPKKTGQTVSR
jgi:hypothetical protein